MKKTIIFAFAALVALASASCQKDRTVEQETIGVPSNITEFVAGIDPCSKLSLGGNGKSILWNPGDEIGIYDGTANVVGGTIFSTTITEPAAKASFVKKDGQTGTPLTVDGKSYAVAPASALYSWRRDVTAAGINIPSLQTVSGPGQLPSGFPILYGSTSDGNITFHHAVGYVCFTLGDSPTNIKQVTLTNLDEEQNLAGKFNINMNTGAIVKTSSATNSLSMTLSISGGGNFPKGKYYIGIPPFTYASGLRLTFQNEENLTDSKDIPAGKTLAAGTVQNIGTVSGLNFAGYVPSLGDPYPSTGTAEGIIVSIDAVNKKALVMSKDEASVFWADADHKSETIGNFPTNSFTGGGKVATDSLITHYNLLKAANPDLADFATVYPAAGWCVNKGDGWFMCSYQNEWKPMVSAFSVNTAAGFAAINEKLAAVDGTALKDNTYYWMISEKGTSTNPSYGGYAKFKTSDGSQDSGYASKKGNSTRPVRAFKTISY